MNKKFKFLTVLLALVMAIGAFAPFSARAEEPTTEATTTEKVILHKVLMDKESFGKVGENGKTVGENGEKYDTRKIEDIAAYFGGKSKEIDGVYFVLKFADDYKEQDKQGKFVKHGADTLTPAYPLEATDKIEEAVGGLTTATGLTFDTSKLEGKFIIDEVREKSTYKGTEKITDKDGKTVEVKTELSGSKAVPVVITLPLKNEKGIIREAHVYPKNIEDKPQIDKNFKKDHFKATDAHEDKNGNIDAGAQYENSGKDKATAKVKVGDVVPYEVKTKISKDAKYKKLVWTDEMTKGLTYNKGSLVVDGAGLTKDDYILLETEKGFTLNIKESGLTKIEDAAKAGDVEITLTYSATVNKTAVPDKVDENHVKLEYYNTPGFTPSEVTPKNQEIEVVKNWATDGNQAVTEADKKAVIGYTLQEKIGDNKWKDVETVVKTYSEEAGEKSFDHKFTGLDDNKTYRVVETVMGYDPEYKTEENGKVKIVNKKTENPNVLEPTDPKVITGGRRFVKTDDEKNRLEGAEFYVKNANGEYLVHSSIVENANNKKELDDAKDARDTAYEEYNKMSKADQEGEAGKKKIEEMKKLQEKYEDLLNKYSDSYTWGKKDDKHVVILTSDKEGRFEITGLKYGNYFLEEKTAPKGFAKLEQDIPFEVKFGSYKGDKAKDMKYNPEDKDADENTVYGQQVINKKYTIPQTGGIGTVIFTVVGVMLMVGAAFALKRRKEDELEGLA